MESSSFETDAGPSTSGSLHLDDNPPRKQTTAGECSDDVEKQNSTALVLRSLPVEILRVVLRLSVDKDEELDAVLFLKRTFVSQSVCRHFRDIVQSSPEFWTAMSSNIPQLFEIQLERSRQCDLTLDLYAPYLHDETVSDIFRLHANRWRSLRIHVPERGYNKVVCDQISSLNLEKLISLELIHTYPRRGSMGLEMHLEPHNICDCLAERTPNLLHLHITNLQQIGHVPDGLTSLTLSIRESSVWSPLHFLTFIAANRCLRKLDLYIRNNANSEEDFINFLLECSADNSRLGRGMDIALKLDGQLSVNSSKSIWAFLGRRIGIGHLHIDLSDVPNQPQSIGFLCKALRFSSTTSVPELQTLTISLATSVAPVWSCTDQHDDYDNHELPSSLQTLTVRNCTIAALEIIHMLVARLVQRQVSLGVPPLARLVMIDNRLPCRAGRVAIEDLLGKERVDWRLEL